MQLRMILTLIILLLSGSTSHAKDHIHSEKYYQDVWCNQQNGFSEVLLKDKTRCDCITETHAIEVEFAKKFYEAIGQSLYYSLSTKKNAGILLIIENTEDNIYWIRMNSIIQYFNLPITVWTYNGDK